MRIDTNTRPRPREDLNSQGAGTDGPAGKAVREGSPLLQGLALGNHLGVTGSPQFPLPAGYVTLSVDDRSPPHGLMPPHSRKQGILQILLSQCIPVICTPDHPGRGAL